MTDDVHATQTVYDRRRRPRDNVAKDPSGKRLAVVLAPAGFFRLRLANQASSRRAAHRAAMADRQFTPRAIESNVLTTWDGGHSWH